MLTNIVIWLTFYFILTLIFVTSLYWLLYFYHLASSFYSLNLYTYKINTFHRTSIVLFLSFLSIVGLYLNRLSRLGNAIDLKEFFSTSKHGLGILYDNLGLYGILIILLIFFTLCIMLCIPATILHKYLILEFMRFYIKFMYLYCHLTYPRIYRMFNNLYSIYEYDLIAEAFMGITKNINEFFNPFPMTYTKEADGTWPSKLNAFCVRSFSSKTYENLRNFSPLFFLAYDCLFNNWVLYHVFYWLAFFVPLMLFRRFTIAIGNTDICLITAIGLIYYDPTPRLYAVPSKYMNMFYQYFVEFFPVYCAGDPQALFSSYIHFGLLNFVLYDKDRNAYVNNYGITIQYFPNGNAYEEVEDENGNVHLGQEWIVIANKYEKENP